MRIGSCSCTGLPAGTPCGKSPSTSSSHYLQLVSTTKLLDLVTCGTKRPSTYNYTHIVHPHHPKSKNGHIPHLREKDNIIFRAKCFVFFVCPGSKGWFATKEFYILGKGFQPKAMNASWEGGATQAKVVFNHYLPPWMADFYAKSRQMQQFSLEVNVTINKNGATPFG